LSKFKFHFFDPRISNKNKKAKLIESKQYKGQARKEIARQFGRMLSYPESKIDELINQNKPEK